MLPCKPINIPKSVIDLIVPLILSLVEKFCEKFSQGFGKHCFIPSDTRLFSTSISRIITSTSSPIFAILWGLGLLFVQSISETWTKPSIPSLISTKRP